MLRCKIHGIYVVKDKKDKRTYMVRVIIGLAQLEEGRIIRYTLPPREKPTIPNKVWRGRIVHVYHSRCNDVNGVMVECLEPGYEGLSELVFPYQIASIE
jgi:hypothetical protein